MQSWRNSMRNETRASAVGVLTQARPWTRSPSPSHAGARPRLDSGYPVFFTATTTTNNGFGVSPGAFCAKSMFANLKLRRVRDLGLRDGGVAISGTTCTLVAGLNSVENGSCRRPPRRR
jgi:hypothetical protein